MTGKALLTVLVCLSMAAGAWAIDASPLQNAYWRLEEGTAGQKVPVGEHTVLDAIGEGGTANPNHMQASTLDFSPVYTSVVSPAPLRSGLPNTLALDFAGSQDIFTKGGEGGAAINHPKNPDTTAFTIEAAFRLDALGAFQAIIGKEGNPNAANEQTAVLKVRDNNLLQWEQFDAAGNLVSVSSLATMSTNQWYHAAVVNDGSTLSLYLDTFGDNSGYELQSQVAVSGALFQNETSWSIGKGAYAGAPSDYFNGTIDEVRISNTALSPEQFLFLPEPASLILLGLGGLCLLQRRCRSS